MWRAGTFFIHSHSHKLRNGLTQTFSVCVLHSEVRLKVNIVCIYIMSVSVYGTLTSERWLTISLSFIHVGSPECPRQSLPENL